MPLFLLTLWGKAKFYVIGFALGALALAGLYFDVERKGENKVKAQEAAATETTLEFQQKDEKVTAAMSDSAVLDSVLSDRNKLLQDR